MEVGEGRTKCFWLDRTGKMRLQLRRFTFSADDDDPSRAGHRDCPVEGRWGHDASVLLPDEHDVLKTERDKDGWEGLAIVPDELRPARDDPLWPTVCEACGEPFLDTDEWQVNQVEVYVRGDTGERLAHRGYSDPALAGALLDLWWRHGMAAEDGQGYVGRDGIALGAVCPNGVLWEVDGTATGGGRWARTGDPRRPDSLTVSPSIAIGGDYHGFLQSGWFTDHLG